MANEKFLINQFFNALLKKKWLNYIFIYQVQIANRIVMITVKIRLNIT